MTEGKLMVERKKSGVLKAKLIATEAEVRKVKMESVTLARALSDLLDEEEGIRGRISEDVIRVLEKMGFEDVEEEESAGNESEEWGEDYLEEDVEHLEHGHSSDEEEQDTGGTVATVFIPPSPNVHLIPLVGEISGTTSFSPVVPAPTVHPLDDSDDEFFEATDVREEDDQLASGSEDDSGARKSKRVRTVSNVQSGG